MEPRQHLCGAIIHSVYLVACIQVNCIHTNKLFTVNFIMWLLDLVVCSWQEAKIIVMFQLFQLRLDFIIQHPVILRKLETVSVVLLNNCNALGVIPSFIHKAVFTVWTYYLKDLGSFVWSSTVLQCEDVYYGRYLLIIIYKTKTLIAKCLNSKPQKLHSKH